MLDLVVKNHIRDDVKRTVSDMVANSFGQKDKIKYLKKQWNFHKKVMKQVFYEEIEREEKINNLKN